MELFTSKGEEGLLPIRTLLYVVLTFSAFVLIIVKTLGRNPRHVECAALLKGPTPIPIFGNSLQFMAAGKEAPTKLMLNWRKKYGSVFRLWFGNDLYVVISDIDCLKDALNNRKLMWLGPLFKDLLYFLIGFEAPEKGTWKVLRSVQSHFSPGTVKSLVPKLNERIAQLMDDLQKKSGSEFNVIDIIFDTVFDMFTSTQFDYVLDSQSKKRFDFRSKVAKMMALVVGLPLLWPGMRTKFSRYLINNMFVNPLKKSYHSYIRMMTNGKISAIQNDARKSTNLEHHKLSSLWTLYKKNHLKLNTDGVNTSTNDESTISTAGGLILAGIESTYATISTALLMIAMHDSVQDKLQEEIREVFGGDQRQANYDDVERLSYMDQVISETTRRNTPTSLLFRYVSEDTQIGPYKVPKGTYLIIDLNSVHSDEKFYPRPLEFNPDNFSEEMVAKRSPYAYLAFSAGTRACMGQSFARTQIKLVLVEILRKFIVRTSLRMDDMKYVTVLGTQSANGYPIKFVPRE